MISKTIKFLDVVTATTTSDPVNIEGCVKMTLQFIRADHSAGSTSFAVSVSQDGVNWVTYNKLIANVINAIAEGLVRVAASSLASATSKMYSMDLENDTYKWMRVTATETTDGTHSAIGVGLFVN